MGDPSAYSFSEIRECLTPESKAYRELRDWVLERGEWNSYVVDRNCLDAFRADGSHEEALEALDGALWSMTLNTSVCSGPCDPCEEGDGQFRRSEEGGTSWGREESTVVHTVHSCGGSLGGLLRGAWNRSRRVVPQLGRRGAVRV